MSDKPIIDGLWNVDMTSSDYGSLEQYRQHIFEQYKLFVEMADQTSARRNLANTFFLTINTFFIGLIALAAEKVARPVHPVMLLFPLIACLALCYVWWRLLHSYRQLNAAKYKIIGEYERLLPTSPYWSAEWSALGRGREPKLYKPLTDVEHWVPFIFALLYIFIAIAFWFL